MWTIGTIWVGRNRSPSRSSRSARAGSFAPHYARFRATGGSATFSVHAVDSLAEPPKTVAYFECAALDEQVATLQAKGLHFARSPRDEPWLWREARLVDPSGNVVCLYRAGDNRLNPPWRVAGNP